MKLEIEKIYAAYNLIVPRYIDVERSSLTKLDRSTIHRFTKITDVLIENSTLTGKNRDDLLINTGILKRVSISCTSSKSRFINVFFDDCTFKNARLTDAVFINCRFANNAFEQSTLYNVTFICCEFEDCLVSNVNLKEMTFINSINPDSVGILFSDMEIEDNPEIKIVRDEHLLDFLNSGDVEIEQEPIVEQQHDVPKENIKENESEVMDMDMAIYEKQVFNVDLGMSKKHFYECEFNRLNITKQLLQTETEFSSCRFNSSIFNETTFKDVIFDESIFSNCTFINCSFSRCSLIMTDLSLSKLNECKFYRCNLFNAKLPDNFIVTNEIEDSSMPIPQKNDVSGNVQEPKKMSNIVDVQQALADIIAFLASPELANSFVKPVTEEDVETYFKSLDMGHAMALAAKMLNPAFYRDIPSSEPVKQESESSAKGKKITNGMM
ncbi:Pentapeptide repeats (8 copies) [Clostridiales bacterium CHKCI006]|nr:Pentapeptide repeats (8 copies) [Clostridiales bacterium CHKCI006]